MEQQENNIIEETQVQAAEESISGAESAESRETAVTEEKPASEKKDEEDSYDMKALLKDFLDLVESVVLSVFVVVLVFTFLFCVANVDGDSMLPTLTDGDRLIVSRLHTRYDDGDILIINSEKSCLLDESGNVKEQTGIEKEIVKRLIAAEGQTVDIDFASGIVYVDGQALDEPYTSTLTNRDYGAFTYPLTIPEGYLFVLGDNRHISKDSRHPDVGLVPESEVIGKVVFRLMPFSKFGTV
ncbi:MAG: signal peptidase I [Oscillospiraceae bacterium]|nr:signal peptidase I [Oscillospiraceae bacterium]